MSRPGRRVSGPTGRRLAAGGRPPLPPGSRVGKIPWVKVPRGRGECSCTLLGLRALGHIWTTPGACNGQTGEGEEQRRLRPFPPPSHRHSPSTPRCFYLLQLKRSPLKALVESAHPLQSGQQPPSPPPAPAAERATLKTGYPPGSPAPRSHGWHFSAPRWDAPAARRRARLPAPELPCPAGTDTLAGG